MTTDLHTHLGETRMDYTSITSENVIVEADTLINRMDTFGIDKAVLTSFGSVKFNDLYLKATEVYPDRLFPACVISPRPTDDAVWLLKQYIDQNYVALIIDENLCRSSDPATQDIIQIAVENEMPVFYHFETIGPESLSLIDRVSTLFPDGKFVVLSMGGLFGFPQLLTLSHRDNIWIEISSTLIRLVESPLRIFFDAFLQDGGVRSLVFGSEHHSEYSNIMAALNSINLNVETSRILRQENAWVILGLDFS